MSSKLLTGFLLGAATGAVLGILYAPDKGSATRKKIVDKSGELGDTLKNKFNEFGEALSEKYDTIREEAKSILNKGKETAQNVKDTAQTFKDETKRTFA